MSHADLFERAYYINAAGSTRRRAFMEEQLHASGVRFERWPAIRGGPELLRTHAKYFERGVEQHLYVNRSAASGTSTGAETSVRSNASAALPQPASTCCKASPRNGTPAPRAATCACAGVLRRTPSTRSRKSGKLL